MPPEKIGVHLGTAVMRQRGLTCTLNEKGEIAISTVAAEGYSRIIGFTGESPKEPTGKIGTRQIVRSHPTTKGETQ